jgi:hypothetical protein
MKYPQKQFETLVNGLKKLAPLLDIKESNPHSLHYIIYQQFSEGQKHNWLYCCPGGKLQKAHKIENIAECEKLFSEQTEFELYPSGCNDTHIETAMKAAIKYLYP